MTEQMTAVHFWHMIDGGHWDTANGIEDCINQHWYLKGMRKQVEKRVWEHIGYGPEVLSTGRPHSPVLEIQELEDGFIVYIKDVGEEHSEDHQKFVEEDLGGEDVELYYSCRIIDALPKEGFHKTFHNPGLNIGYYIDPKDPRGLHIDYYDLTRLELERLR